MNASGKDLRAYVEPQLNCSEERLLERIGETFPSFYWRWELEGSSGSDTPVEVELAKRLPHINPESWPARFELGGVYLSGRQATLGQQVYPPCRLEYYEPRLPLERVAERYPGISAESILYRDEDFAVVLKPAGLPSTAPRDQNRYHLQAALEKLLGQVVHLPSRLDTGVAGLLIASLSPRMNRFLQRAYDARRIEKYYLCSVAGWPMWTERLCEAPIERDPRHPVLRRCTGDVGRGVPAATRFVRLASYQVDGGRRALLQAEPVTGRTHQIRLHCKWEGISIIGDPYYSEQVEGAELQLVSYALRLFHPYRAQRMTWEIPPESLPDWLAKAGPYEIYYRAGRGLGHTKE